MGYTGYAGLQTFVHNISSNLFISHNYKDEATAMVQSIINYNTKKNNKYMKYKTKYLTLKNKMLDIV
jgi:hypothetical protein